MKCAWLEKISNTDVSKTCQKCIESLVQILIGSKVYQSQGRYEPHIFQRKQCNEHTPIEDFMTHFIQFSFLKVKYIQILYLLSQKQKQQQTTATTTRGTLGIQVMRIIMHQTIWKTNNKTNDVFFFSDNYSKPTTWSKTQLSTVLQSAVAYYTPHNKQNKVTFKAKFQVCIRATKKLVSTYRE